MRYRTVVRRDDQEDAETIDAVKPIAVVSTIEATK